MLSIYEMYKRQPFTKDSLKYSCIICNYKVCYVCNFFLKKKQVYVKKAQIDWFK